MKKLIIIPCILLAINCLAVKHTIRIDMVSDDEVCRNTAHTYLSSKSSLTWVRRNNPSSTATYTVMVGTPPVVQGYGVKANLIINKIANRDSIENKIKTFLQNNNSKIISYTIEIIRCPHDERPGRRSKILRRWVK